jgi:hypothetical protein
MRLSSASFFTFQNCFSKRLLNVAIFLIAFTMSLTALAQDPPIYLFDSDDPTWVENGAGTSFSVTPISENYANELWERPTEADKTSNVGGSKVTTGKYYAYSDLQYGAWGYGNVGGTDYLFIKWDVVGGYDKEPGKAADTGVGYKGHYYFYAKLPGKKGFLIEITDASKFSSSYGDDDNLKVWLEETEDDATDTTEGYKSSSDPSSSEGRQNGTVMEVAIAFSDIPGYTLADFTGGTAEYAHVGAAVSNPSAASDVHANANFPNDHNNGVEYDTILMDNPIASSLTVEKIITSNNGGTADLGDFAITWDDGGGPYAVAWSDDTQTSGFEVVANSAGTYTLAEGTVTGYTNGTWSCSDADGAVTVTPASNNYDDAEVTVGEGQAVTCTITNTDDPASLTVSKTIASDNGGMATLATFDVEVDNVDVPWSNPASLTGESKLVTDRNGHPCH